MNARTAAAPSQAERVAPRMSDRHWLLLAGAWLAFLAWLRPLTLPDEGRYAGVAWDMLRSGEWATPLLNGMPYFHKPPLFYWLDMLSFQLFGLHEWAARIPSLLSAWAMVLALYGFARRYLGRTTARLACLVLALMPLFYGGAQFANLDMLVAGMLGLCVLAGADTVLRRTEGRPHRAMAMATAALAGLAVLSKGLIGVCLPGLILVLWLVLRRDGRGALALLWPPAIALFLLVALPWFALMQARYPGFFHYMFVYQQFDRFSGTGFNNAQPFWFYLPVLLAGALPWVLWGRALVGKAFWTRQRDPQGLRLLAACWLGVVLVFFSLPASKLIGYIFPALPALALLLAICIGERLERDEPAHGRRRLLQYSGVAMAICVLAIVASTVATRPNSSRQAGALLRAQWQPGDTVVALGSYPFDLAFYGRLAAPLQVVEDWHDPGIPARDNWRKELFDAGRFDPTAANQVLLSASTWHAELCRAPDHARFWIWSDTRGGGIHATLLGDRQPILSTRRNRLWRLDLSEQLRQRACAAAGFQPG